MFADIHFIDFLRANPALAVFVTLALGFLVGKLRWRSFSLGTVTSVLGHYIGSGLAIKNGSKIVKPTGIIVLILLAIKVLQGLISG